MMISYIRSLMGAVSRPRREETVLIPRESQDRGDEGQPRQSVVVRYSDIAGANGKSRNKQAVTKTRSKKIISM